MSGYQRPRSATSRGRLVIPRVAQGGAALPLVPQINAAFATIELADADNLKRGLEPSFPSVLLTDSNGVTWRLRVFPDGSLRTFKVEPP